MSDELEKAINDRREVQEKLDAFDEVIKNVLTDLYAKKKVLQKKVSDAEESVSKEKEEISQIDAELQRIIAESGMDAFVVEGRQLYYGIEKTAIYDEPDKFFPWVVENLGNGSLDVLKADILSKKAITKCFDEGKMPPGVRIKTFRKFKDVAAK